MIKAYAVMQPGGELQPFEYEPGPQGDQVSQFIAGNRVVLKN